MIFLRVLLVVAMLALGWCVLLYFFTRNSRYLMIAWQLLRIGVLAFIIVGALVLVERFVLI